MVLPPSLARTDRFSDGRYRLVDKDALRAGIDRLSRGQPPGSSRSLSRASARRDDRIGERADGVGVHLDDVARLHEELGRAAVADAGRGAGGDHVAGTETVELRIMRDELGDAEDEVAGVGGLHDRAVETGREMDIGGIGKLVAG